MNDPSLAPLLEIQTLDLEVRDAEARARELPAREVLVAKAREIAAAEAARGQVVAEIDGYADEEHALGEAVSQVSKEIETAEVERYSGKQKSRDEAVAHDEAQATRRARQTELEEQEMMLLESIEDAEGRSAALVEQIESAKGDAEIANQQIREVEAAVADEVSRCQATKEGLAAGVPDEVMAAYERVRTQERKAGRGAAPLGEGACGACRIKLPVEEYRTMLRSEEGTLLQCPQCRRVLVRA